MTLEISVADTGPESGGARSAVSWPAVLAGTVVAAALSLVLLALGSGFGLAAASPWPGMAPGAATFSITAGLWLIVMQWLSSALGGYITGRLRTRWTGVHSHEVFFRDTAHGLLTWALATVLVAALAFAATSSAVSSAAGAAPAAAMSVDRLFRSTAPVDAQSAAAARNQAARILMADPNDNASAEDRAYLVASISRATGVAPAEAQRRLDAEDGRMKAAADKARKAASAVAIFTALSLLIGAFIACVAAALGGQQRDEHL